MERHRTAARGRRLTSHWPNRIFFASLFLMVILASTAAQQTQRDQPVWWVGGVGAANLNFYSGTTQMLNAGLTTPAAFHKGFGAGFFLAGLLEYRPDPVWGGILQVGYDDRRGSFSEVPCPCGELANLSTTISYASIEPSLRFAPFSNGFYVYGGPRIAFNWAPNIGSGSVADEKQFIYTQEGVTTTKATFSQMRTTQVSGQIGVGYDIAFASSNARTQVNLSPFLSYHPYFGAEPRSVENWGVSTLRLGIALKFGSGSVIPPPERAVVPEPEVQFSVRAPKAVPVQRRVRETFPLSNHVVFEVGSTEIPPRYEALTKEQAASFKEDQLQEVQPKSHAGRSLRQMTVYYNILNVLGDRMKRSPGTTVELIGASGNGPEHGKARAESVKRYLVEVFGVEASRITTVGRDKPRIPSEVRGATKELVFLQAEDSRVEIVSTSPELMIQVGGTPHYVLKPVQIVAVVEDPLDAHVLFNVVGAEQSLASWSLELTDSRGNVQRFGPSTRERESISGNAILGDRSQGDYKVVMLGETKSGKFVRKESTVRLVRRMEPTKETVRYRILFDFDQSKSVAKYENFLTAMVAPQIPDNSVVVIHGYTDIVGEEAHNDNLSRERVQDTQTTLERALAKGGQKGVTFDTIWFGEDLTHTQFDNNLPEGRWYNRAVIIDIIPD